MLNLITFKKLSNVQGRTDLTGGLSEISCGTIPVFPVNRAISIYACKITGSFGCYKAAILSSLNQLLNN